MLISATPQRISWPPSVTSMSWSDSSTGNDATRRPILGRNLPSRSRLSMATMPLPPRPVVRYSYEEVRLP